MTTRLAMFFATAVAALASAHRKCAQVSTPYDYQFTNSAGGNWSTAANWSGSTTPPFGSTNVDTIYDMSAVNGTSQTLVPTTIDSGVPGQSVTLSELSLNRASTYGFQVSGGTLNFIPFTSNNGTGDDTTYNPQIYVNSSSTTTSVGSLLPLVIKSNINISSTVATGSTFPTLDLVATSSVANSTAYPPYAIVLRGTITGAAGTIINQAVNYAGDAVMITSSNNSFAGVVDLTTGSMLLEGANALGRLSSVNTGGNSNTADGLQIKSDQGKNSLLGTVAYQIEAQQIGTLGYVSGTGVGGKPGTGSHGFIELGDVNATVPNVPGNVLFGFLNTNSTIDAQINSAVYQSNLIKVGTGTSTITGATAANQYIGGLMILGGGITLTGNLSGTAGAAGYGAVVVDAGTTLTITNTSKILATPLNPLSAINLNGGAFTITGLNAGTATAAAPSLGALTVGGGQSVLSLQPGSKGNVNPTFASAAATGLGTLVVRGTGLGTNTGTASELFFTTAPAMTNSIIPWMTVNAISGTGNPTDLATYGASGVVVPTYGSSSLATTSGATVNVKDTTTGTINSSATAVNSLVLSGATTLSQTGTLAITSGAVLDTTASSITGGTLAFGTNGYFTTTTTVNIGSAVTAGTALALADGTSGGTAPITLSGAVTLSTGGTFAINAGTVNVTGAPSGTNVTTLIAGGATLASSGGYSIASGSTLAGNGTISASTVTISGTVNPKTFSGGPGLLSVTGNMAFTTGSTYVWSVASVITDSPVSTTLGSGTTQHGYTASWINSTGSLNLTGLSNGAITIVVNALTANFAYNSGATAGTIYDLQPGQVYSWTIASFSGGITGFSPSEFTVNHSAFDTVNVASQWSITQVGNNLVINAVTPEPGGLLLVASIGLGLGGLVRCYRNRKVVAV